MILRRVTREGAVEQALPSTPQASPTSPGGKGGRQRHLTYLNPSVPNVSNVPHQVPTPPSSFGLSATISSSRPSEPFNPMPLIS